MEVSDELSSIVLYLLLIDSFEVCVFLSVYFCVRVVYLGTHGPLSCPVRV